MINIMKILLASLLVLAGGACERPSGRPVSPVSPMEAQGTPAFEAPEAEGPALPRAVLLRGNTPVKGLPGFGENAFAAVFGEYGLELETGAEAPGTEAGAKAPGAEAPLGFSVWISREVYFPESLWERSADLQNYPVYLQEEEGALLIAVVLSDGGAFGGKPEGPRSALFRFPDAARAAFSAESGGLNGIILPWLNRFLYFFSIAQREADISLPANVGF
jgi:hypothetical protein